MYIKAHLCCLHRPELFGELLREDEQVIQRREQCRARCAALTAALKALASVPSVHGASALPSRTQSFVVKASAGSHASQPFASRV